ncbi:MAG: hypothetical protein DMF68_13665 [Acidobacteria bacterium]|nr:MAG: hypothetical protein DMF68_13665 [Acidobacteriota bacterium]
MSNPLQKSYFFIYAEWVERPATNIVAPGEQPPQAHLRGANAVIDVHPVVYLAAMTRENPSYNIKFAMQITRQMYEMIVGVEEQRNGDHKAEAKQEDETL